MKVEKNRREGGWVKINKPTGKGTRAVGDKNETKQEEGKRNNEERCASESVGATPTQAIQRSMIKVMRITKNQGRTACC